MSMKLEVKVNDGGFLIDATMEVKDGVILITPKAPLSNKVEGKWTPDIGERFYHPLFTGEKFYTMAGEENKIISVTEWEEYKKGWIFKTRKECQQLCDKLNTAIAVVTR